MKFAKSTVLFLREVPHTEMQERESKMEPPAKTRAKRNVSYVLISLRAVVSVIPWTSMKQAELEEDLQCIGCYGLMTKPSTFKDNNFFWELLVGVPN